VNKFTTYFARSVNVLVGLLLASNLMQGDSDL
jgi:hypothetical protein